ncbi:hypothetical protein [Rhizobium sp. X9]|uniref:hypothetical protein n=1 Tax=Rhizobium sp. X9 TaxID=2815360 RepID=UPI001C0CB564|nr:hypothetical protein [Rhizobium sp. X9]
MSLGPTKSCFNEVDRIMLDGRAVRHHIASQDGTLVQFDGDDPREVFELSCRDLGDHLRTLRLAMHKDYYKLVKSGVLSTFSNDQVAYFRRHACSVFSVTRPTVRQVYREMQAHHRWRMERGEPIFELCSERAFHRLVDEMRRSANETARLMAASTPMIETRSN